jgi:hypothetical protein
MSKSSTGTYIAAFGFAMLIGSLTMNAVAAIAAIFIVFGLVQIIVGTCEGVLKRLGK